MQQQAHRRSAPGLRAVLTASVVLVLVACGGGSDKRSASSGSSSGASRSGSGSAATKSHQPSPIESWIADVVLLGAPIDDYTQCLAEAATAAGSDQIPNALSVKTNAELSRAYDTAPKVMDAVNAAQASTCAGLVSSSSSTSN